MAFFYLYFFKFLFSAPEFHCLWYDCLLFRLVSTAVDIIRYYLPGSLGISGLPRQTEGEKPAFVCQEFSLLRWKEVKAFRFSVCFSEADAGTKRRGRVALSQTAYCYFWGLFCFGCLPGNDEITVMLLLKSSWSALWPEQLVRSPLIDTISRNYLSKKKKKRCLWRKQFKNK